MKYLWRKEKIDELQVIASNFNVSIICVTET